MVNNSTLTATKYTGVFYRLTKNNDKVFYITYMQNKKYTKEKMASSVYLTPTKVPTITTGMKITYQG